MLPSMHLVSGDSWTFSWTSSASSVVTSPACDSLLVSEFWPLPTLPGSPPQGTIRCNALWDVAGQCHGKALLTWPRQHPQRLPKNLRLEPFSAEEDEDKLQPYDGVVALESGPWKGRVHTGPQGQGREEENQKPGSFLCAGYCGVYRSIFVYTNLLVLCQSTVLG